MTDERKNNNEDRSKDNIAPKPDPETLHTTDPQEKMEGPVSSLMHNTGGAFDTGETKEEADTKKDEKM